MNPKIKKSELTKVDGEWIQKSQNEVSNLDLLKASFTKNIPQLGPQWNSHQMSWLTRQSISRIIYLDQLYKLAINVPGVICEFGVQWGSTLVQLMNLRGIYEPFNHSRKIFGFDTFEGFPNVSSEDQNYSEIGDYKTVQNWEHQLEEILAIHESMSPLPHIRKFELIKGDASVTVPEWVEKNPHLIIGMAFFDMDVYMPTRVALEAIIPRLTKGSLVVFDQLNSEHFPGETQAVQEVLGLNNLSLKSFPHQPNCAWAVYGG